MSVRKGASADAVTPAKFEVEGVLTHQRSSREDGSSCRCCKSIPGDGHIFMYGVDLQEMVPGACGPRLEHPGEWVSRVLYPLRGRDGARVRITLEVDPPEGSFKALCTMAREILDRSYPADIFNTENPIVGEDPGTRLVAALREVLAVRS